MDTFQYVGRFNTLRSGLTGLPGWARLIVSIAALPGLVLALLSIALLLVSIIALLLLTAPVYRFLQLVCLSRPGVQGNVTVQAVQDVESPGRRQIDAKVIE